MNLVSTVVLCLAFAQSVLGATIDHDKVQPFKQPDPVTVSEKAALKYKPQLVIGGGCVSFPAVNAAGDITGGLKGTKSTDGCTEAPLGSQAYGRSTWYQDKWAMMFAWYFPKNFWGGGADSRHLWSNMVVWIDNPSLETPKILGVSLSQQTIDVPKLFFIFPLADRQKDPYRKVTVIDPMDFAGMQAIKTKIRRRRYTYNYTGGSNTSTRVFHGYTDKSGWHGLAFDKGFVKADGEYQDLIMWNQLTDQTRSALESADFGEKTKVPFDDKNFEAALTQAWPF